MSNTLNLQALRVAQKHCTLIKVILADLVVLHSATLYKCWLLFHRLTSYVHAIILGLINFFPKIGG